MATNWSQDWLLISVLIKLHAARAVRAEACTECIEKWRHRLSALCVAIALAWGVWGEKSSHDVMILFMAAVLLPQVFGWWICEQIRHHNRVPDHEEVGLCAARILSDIADMAVYNASYVPTFVSLLEAVRDDDVEIARARTDDLDAYGNYAIELTRLVRAAYA